MAMKTIYDDTLSPLSAVKKGDFFKTESGKEYKMVDPTKNQVKPYLYGKIKSKVLYISALVKEVYVGRRVKDG